MNRKQIIILTGTARSGTSALTSFLNAHPMICIGMERYKYQMLNKGNFSPSLFTYERFFDFKNTDTNVLPRLLPHIAKLYNVMRIKYPKALYLGDKIPNLAPHLNSIRKSIPVAIFIYIIRNVYEVASSWKMRAENKKDIWPENFSYMMAAKKWTEHNIALQKFIDNSERNHRIHIVFYEDFFLGKDLELEKLMSFLKINYNNRVKNNYAQVVKYYLDNIKNKEICLTKEQIAKINTIVDLNVYEILKNKSSIC